MLVVRVCLCVCVWGGCSVWKTQLFVSMFMHLWAWIYICLSDRQPQRTSMSECIICLLCDSTHKWTKMSHGEIQSVIHRLRPLCANRGQHFLINARQSVQVRCEPRGRMPLCFSHTVSQPVTYLRLLAQWTPKEECVANLKHAVCLLVVKAVWRTWLELHFMTGSPFLMCHISVC